MHRIFGGVVPEIASRAHLTAIVPVVERALADAGVDAIDAVAVTNAPGLVGALLVGVSYAKAFAFARGIPVIGVHHMEGHLFATALEHRDAVPPFTALLVSGGHTLLLDVEAWGRYRLLGRTRDDAAGEAFDKVAKLLGLPYPGGPHVERLARDERRADAFRFARPMVRRDQTPGRCRLLRCLVQRPQDRGAQRREVAAPTSTTSARAIARAFQDALIDTLVEKTARAARQFGRGRVVLGGGVACNATLVARHAGTIRARAGSRCSRRRARLATDNAAMIARAGLFHLERGERSPLDLNAFATQPIPGLVAA